MKKLFCVLALLMVSACTMPCYDSYCGNYGEQVYTETQPVEVIFRKTTYRTVLEPKTYKTESYERMNISNCYTSQSGNYCR